MNQFGQLIMTGIKGTALTQEEATFLEKEDVGGVILFSHNYENPAQLAELVNSIQKTRNEYPLFIAADQEGGRVMRFRNQFTPLPSPMDVVLLDSPKISFHLTKIMAEELAACGVNVNLAPCCDILTNENNKAIGDRAYGTDADTVSKYISSIIRGLQVNGVMACAKHFPGQGDTSKDTHTDDIAVIKRSLEELRERELIPFVKAAKARVDFILMSHATVDGIDPDLPCSLSEKAYRLLRDELRFTKIAITDDMQMKAISDRYSMEDAVIRSINAGANMLIYRDMDQAEAALKIIKEAVRTKKIKNETIKSSFDTILELKKEQLSEYKPIYIPEISKKVNTRASQVFIQDILARLEKAKTN
jgi:beta-N-acetylhexosaminidase